MKRIKRNEIGFRRCDKDLNHDVCNGRCVPEKEKQRKEKERQTDRQKEKIRKGDGSINCAYAWHTPSPLHNRRPIFFPSWNMISLHPKQLLNSFEQIGKTPFKPNHQFTRKSDVLFWTFKLKTFRSEQISSQNIPMYSLKEVNNWDLVESSSKLLVLIYTVNKHYMLAYTTD